MFRTLSPRETEFHYGKQRSEWLNVSAAAASCSRPVPRSSPAPLSARRKPTPRTPRSAFTAPPSTVTRPPCTTPTSPSAHQPWPVVLLLQGANVGRAAYAGFARKVASYGFVVVVPDHTRVIFGVPGLYADGAEATWTVTWATAENARTGSPLRTRSTPARSCSPGTRSAARPASACPRACPRHRSRTCRSRRRRSSRRPRSTARTTPSPARRSSRRSPTPSRSRSSRAPPTASAARPTASAPTRSCRAAEAVRQRHRRQPLRHHRHPEPGRRPARGVPADP